MHDQGGAMSSDASMPDPPEMEGSILESRVGGQLRSLMTIAAAVAASRQFEDFLALTAEEACRALGASSVSISRLDPERDELQTIVNVGEIDPSEEHRPADERHLLSEYPNVAAALKAAEPRLFSVDDPSTSPEDRAALTRLGRESAASMPIVVGDQAWGELWVSTAPGARRFTGDDLGLLGAVAEHVAAGVTEAEYMTRLAGYAYDDGLTGLLNRRGFEERLSDALADTAHEDERARPVSLVVCDVDNLKDVNDSYGHEAGDRMLVHVADALRTAAATAHGAVACRLGGDEFAILLDGHGPDVARRVAQMAVDRLARTQRHPITISCGVVSTEAGRLQPAALLRAADAAQYRAKHTREGSVVVGSTLASHPASEPGQRRSHRDRSVVDLQLLLEHCIERLDEGTDETPAQRLAGIAEVACAALPVDAWAVLRVDAEPPSAPRGAQTVRSWAEATRGSAPGRDGPPAEYPPAVLRPAVEGETVHLFTDEDTEWDGLRPARGAVAVVLAGSGGHLLRLDVGDLIAARQLPSAVRLLVGAALQGS